MSTQWVQHNSGNGKKYQVVGDHEHTQKFCWVVWNDDAKVTRNTFHLPQSEYRLCDPPETWVDVTAVCNTFTSHVHKDHCEVWHGSNRLFVVGNELVTDYRLRKVEVNVVGPGVPHGCQKQWAFIVERKEAQS